METVQDNFRRYGLLDDQVVFLQGWFKDTLPHLTRILDHLQLCSGLSNVAGFLLDPRDSLSEAREILGPQRLMLGNVNGPGLARMQPDKAYASVSTLLADRASDRNFVFASSHADILYDTGPDTLLAVRKAVMDAGEVA